MSNVTALQMLAISTGTPRGIAGALAAVGLTALTLGLLIRSRSLIGQTTLTAPWLWCLAGIGSLGLVEVIVQCRQEAPVEWLNAARFIAAALTLCPAVAVMGAKRPQNRAWNFVVLALFGIISLPSVLTLAVGRGAQWRLSDLRGVILWILVVLPAVNYAPTRFAWAAVLVVLGEVILLAPQLPLLGASFSSTDPGLVGLTCFAAAAVVVCQTSASDLRSRHPLDRLWLDFRDRFGLFWALRVQERVNAAATPFGWPFYLSWSGFRDRHDQRLLIDIPKEHEQSLRQTLRGLLWRFATSEWIADRLPAGVD